MDYMGKKLNTLDYLEKKVSSFENELKSLKLSVSDHLKKIDEKVLKADERVDTLEFSLGVVIDELSQLKKQKSTMQDELLYVQSQSMRNNLIFSNLTEPEQETPIQCETLLKSLITDKLKMAQAIVDEIKFERVHRIGHKQDDADYPRKIVAKFCNAKDRELVRKQAAQLHGTKYYISEQFPREIAARRKNLLPKLKAAKKDGKKAWLSYDALYIDGHPFTDKKG